MGDRARISDVAAVAGVSVASVSRVLNGLPASAATTRKVQDAAAQVGYRPDARARSLKRGRSDQLSVMVADIGNPVYVAMIRGIEKTVAAAGLRLVVSSTGGDPREEQERLDALAEGFSDGLVISPLRIDHALVTALRAVPVPVVVVGGLPPRVPIDNVRADSPAGVDLAVAHLVAQGRTRLAFLNGPVDTVPGSARQKGFRAAVRRHRVTSEDAWHVTAADFTYDAGLAAATRLVASAGFDAIMAANDLLAVAALRALSDAGLAVPGDVAVVGMDDTDIAALVSPSLTSVDLGSYERGSQAADLLLARLADPDRPAQRRVVAPHLRVRESTAVAS